MSFSGPKASQTTIRSHQAPTTTKITRSLTPAVYPLCNMAWQHWSESVTPVEYPRARAAHCHESYSPPRNTDAIRRRRRRANRFVSSASDDGTRVQTYTPKSNHTGPLNMATCFEQVLFSAPTKKVNLQTNKCYFQHRQRRSTCKRTTILPPEHGNTLRTSAFFSTDKEMKGTKKKKKKKTCSSKANKSSSQRAKSQ